MSKRQGVLPDFMIHELIEHGSIIGAKVEHVQPDSLDLSISDEAYRLEYLFLPRHGEHVRDLIQSLCGRIHDLSQPLERGITYLAKLNESLALPKNVYGYCNPKSSVGRHDVHVRVLADSVARYDAVAPAGFNGELWLAITPNSYPVILPAGECLSQLRLFDHDTRFDETELQVAFKTHKFLYGPAGEQLSYEDIKISDGDGSVLLTLDLTPNNEGIVGYECRGLNHPLDFSKGKKAYDKNEFFHPIYAQGGMVHLREGSFFILSTKEFLDLPDSLAAEIASMDDRSGEFRSHYAGFIGPRFRGTLTLEVRPYHNIIFRDGQPICKVKFERMREIPRVSYAEKVERNYLDQRGPKLSRHFR